MSIRHDLPFHSKVYTKDNFLAWYNTDAAELAEDGFVLMSVTWSPDSSVAVAVFSRIVQAVETGAFGRDDEDVS